MNFEKIKVYVATLNFVFIIIGYEFTTSLFMPLIGGFNALNSQIVTIPYRAVALGLSLLSIFWGVLAFNRTKRFNAYIIGLLIFLFIYGLRIIHDIQAGIVLGGMRTYLCYFVMLIPSVLSMILSYERIDFKKALSLIIFAGFISLSLSFIFARESASEYSRMDGNIALNTISYGHLGVSIFICSAFAILKTRPSIFFKVLFSIIALLAFYTALRAGSRGPVVSLFFVVFFYMASLYKNIVLAAIPSLLVLFLVYLFRESILDLMHNISPVAARRFEALLAGSASGREFIYVDAFNLFLENPLIGCSYIFPIGTEFAGTHPHNIILDGLMGLGILGGLYIVYILSITSYFSYKALSFNIEYAWVALLYIQQMFGRMFSGNIIGSPTLMSLMALCLLIFSGLRKTYIAPRQNVLPPNIPPHMRRRMTSYY